MSLLRQQSSSRPQPNTLPYDLLVKLLLIGESGVGKTSLLMQFDEQTFTPNYITTIGIDFRSKIIDFDSRRVKVQIWDTAGQERFKSITTSYYRGSNAIILVYDVTDEKSFQRINYWLKDIDKHVTDDTPVIKVLIGNKCDLVGKREVSYEQGAKLAEEHGLNFYETSARAPNLAKHPVNKIFEITIQNVIGQLFNSLPLAPQHLISLTKEKPSRQGKCCN